MGHLTRVANALVQNSEQGPNAEQLGQLLKGEAQSNEGWQGGRVGRVLHSCLPLPSHVQSCRGNSWSGGKCLCRDP